MGNNVIFASNHFHCVITMNDKQPESQQHTAEKKRSDMLL